MPDQPNFDDSLDPQSSTLVHSKRLTARTELEVGGGEPVTVREVELFSEDYAVDGASKMGELISCEGAQRGEVPNRRNEENGGPLLDCAKVGLEKVAGG